MKSEEYLQGFSENDLLLLAGMVGNGRAWDDGFYCYEMVHCPIPNEEPSMKQSTARAPELVFSENYLQETAIALGAKS